MQTMTRTLVAALAIPFAALSASAALAQSSIVESGHTAAWYDPARDGEGWVLEILDEARVSVYWYTYDDDGGQRWLTGAGQVLADENGQYIEVPELWVTRGPSFGDAFDPDDVVMEVAGNATLRFDDCQAGTVNWTAFGQSAEMSLTRLTRTMGAGCEPINGIPGEPVQAYAGQSGDWFDQGHNGEGFTVQWLTRDQALVFWFTYDDQGNQAWMTGLGHSSDGVIVVPELTATRGGRFGAAFDPAAVEHVAWGQLDMTLACNDGGMNYESDLPAFGAGSQVLQRLSRLASPACPYVKPGLADIYLAQWTDIPIPQDDSITVRRVTDNGTVVGVRELAGESVGEVVVMAPGETEWTTLSGEEIWRDGPILVSELAERIVVNEPVPAGPLTNERFGPLAWWRNVGWTPVDEMDSSMAVLSGGSRDGSVLLGRGFTDPSRDEQPWIFDPVAGERALPRLDEGALTVPTAASIDAQVVVGSQSFPVITPIPPYIQVTGFEAMRWNNDGEPRLIRNPEGEILASAISCDALCEVVAGNLISELLVGDERYNRAQSWFWTADGRYGLLGNVRATGVYDVDDNPVIEKHWPLAIDAAGSMIVGDFRAYDPLASPQPPLEGFIWTQATGIHAITDVVEATGASAQRWLELRVADLSPDGLRVLVYGRTWETNEHRAAILELSPR